MADATVLAQAKRHQEALELSALRRCDAEVVEKRHKCNHVCVYQYQDGKWEKAGVEGPCFVVKRAVHPLGKVIVLNRLGMSNFVAPFTSHSTVQDAGKIAILRDNQGDATAYGFWVPEEIDRRELVAALETAIREEVSPASPSALAPGLQALFDMVASAPPSASTSSALAPAAAAGEGAGTAAAAAAAAAAGTPAGTLRTAPSGGSVHRVGTDADDAGRSVASDVHAAQPQALLLTKRQLQATLIRLLQDERFVDFIHTEYVETARRAAASRGGTDS